MTIERAEMSLEEFDQRLATLDKDDLEYLYGYFRNEQEPMYIFYLMAALQRNAGRWGSAEIQRINEKILEGT